MPLIILSGYPCSGLTHRATQLRTLLEKTQDELTTTSSPDATTLSKRYKVVIVPTHDASYPRSVYDNARTEKQARAAAFARAKRALTRNTIVILDGMNYIKGYRYQLWCEAKAVGTGCCVVHVGTPADRCVANNEARLRRQQQKQSETARPEGQSSTDTPTESTDNEEAYSRELLDNLIFRYEEPSTHSRWDRPLFTVPWIDAEPPVADIWTALTGIAHPSRADPTTDPATPTPTTTGSCGGQPSDTASVATGTVGTGTGTGIGTRSRPKIKPHAATLQPTATNSSALYDLEKRTSAVIATIRQFTLSSPSASALLASSPNPNPQTPTQTLSTREGPGITIAIPSSETPLFIPAHIALLGSTDDLAGAGGVLALPRLQRLKRQWIGLNRAYVGGNYAVGTGLGRLRGEDVPGAFVRFLNAEISGSEA